MVDHPEAARPLPGATGVLTRLATRYRLVAVVSGRPVAYLLDRLAEAQGVVLCGLYGLEKVADGAVTVAPQAARWRSVIDQVAAAAETQAPAGVFVERKGLSVALHVRGAPEHAEWIASWAHGQAVELGLVARAGKMSVELLPPIATDKGRVVADLADDLRALCFLGDDLGDLPAFDALARLAEAGVDTLAVAVAGDETPDQLLERADLVVDGPEGALALLDMLAAG
ncbi:MAG: trehalose-phosphatase [Actinomycetota bacterium]|nr:trehalose-phosphatase [Actinomycetota bacterium]